MRLLVLVALVIAGCSREPAEAPPAPAKSPVAPASAQAPSSPPAAPQTPPPPPESPKPERKSDSASFAVTEFNSEKTAQLDDCYTASLTWTRPKESPSGEDVTPIDIQRAAMLLAFAGHGFHRDQMPRIALTVLTGKAAKTPSAKDKVDMEKFAEYVATEARQQDHG